MIGRHGNRCERDLITWRINMPGNRENCHWCCHGDRCFDVWKFHWNLIKGIFLRNFNLCNVCRACEFGILLKWIYDYYIKGIKMRFLLIYVEVLKSNFIKPCAFDSYFKRIYKHVKKITKIFYKIRMLCITYNYNKLFYQFGWLKFWQKF